MNHLETIVRRLRLLAVAAAALGLLVIPSAASAKRHDRTRDRNHDGISDKWEKRHGLSTTQRGVGKADPDRDGLNNRGEFKSGTNPRKADSDRDGVTDANEDPDRDGVDNGNETRERTDPRKADTNRNGVKDGKEDADRDRLNNGGEDQAETDPINPDSDGDGVEDGEENTGKIVSFDGTTLTISVFGGATIAGTVDENTYIDCGTDSSGDGSGDDSSTDDGSGDDLGTEDPADDSLPRRVAKDSAADDGSADDGSQDDGSGDDGSLDDGSLDDGSSDDVGGCSPDTLTVGAVVTEAAVSATPDGTFFDAIELAK